MPNIRERAVLNRLRRGDQRPFREDGVGRTTRSAMIDKGWIGPTDRREEYFLTQAGWALTRRGEAEGWLL